jgi:hypothetical protein
MPIRRIVWLLTVVIALGAASAAPGTRSALRGEAGAIVFVARDRCEQLASLGNARPAIKPMAAATDSPYQSPSTRRVLWPSSYQRPPTHELFA